MAAQKVGCWVVPMVVLMAEKTVERSAAQMVALWAAHWVEDLVEPTAV